MASGTRDLDRLVRALNMAVQGAPKKYKLMQRQVSEKFFRNLVHSAPPDDEGRLKSSFYKQPWHGQQEWVEDFKKGSVEVGTSVYYAPMVNEGHVIGVRMKGNSHRKTSAESRKTSAGYTKVKGWADGSFFLEAAEEATDKMLDQVAEDFLAGLLREVAT